MSFVVALGLDSLSKLNGSGEALVRFMQRDVKPFFLGLDPLAFEIGQDVVFFKTESAADAVERDDAAFHHTVDRGFRDAE